MTYIPLAVRYRPKKFSDVVGQDIAVKILARGIQKDRLGSAILFAGTRGVGKTTLARIVAKSIRCENRNPNDSEPCCHCPSCLEFEKDSQMDVIEIDAASNTSVDDIREIIEACRYKPATGNYKIFIIDEVHMLSKSAFNALLKTLEEPPEHVKFLFATTETYKVPETILSRVLRFDLRSLDENLICQHLSSICNQEHVHADINALQLIAKAANGSVRDSLSILDQAINASDNDQLTLQSVKEMLNVVDNSEIIKLLINMSTGDYKKAIEQCRNILHCGMEVSGILNGLCDCVYTATCTKTNVPVNNVFVSIQEFNKLIETTSLAALSKIWQMLIKGAEELKFCDHPEIVLEMLIIRICYTADLPDLADMLKTMDKTPINSGIKQMSRKEEPKTLLDEAMQMFPGAKLQS